MRANKRFPTPIRAAIVAALCTLLAVSATTARSKTPEASAPPLPNFLHSVHAATAPDGGATTIRLLGSFPLSYSVIPEERGIWSLRLEGVDPRLVEREMRIGSAQVERIQVRLVPGVAGPATELEFEGIATQDRRVRVSGNELVVELHGGKGAHIGSVPPTKTLAADAPPGPSDARAALAAPQPLPTTAIPASGTVRDAPSEAPQRVAPVETSSVSLTRLAPTAGPLRIAPAPAVAEGGSGPSELVVSSGKSITLELESPVSRVSVANPQVADAVVISPRQLLINGLVPGNTSLVLWFGSGPSRNYTLSVQMDTEALAERLRQFFPGERIAVGASKETLVLHGTVSRPEVGERAVKLAADYSPKVVNNLTFPPNGRRQILLKVMFAEVSRQAMTELSASFVRIDPNNPRGDHEGLGTTGNPGPLGNWINEPRGPEFNFNDAINIYAFNFRDKIGGFISALRTRGLLQVLAEPTLIAADGQKASFLAGGEFPIPVVQAGAGFTSVTIVFKKFGIALDFTPGIREDGTIVLRVEPEVSSLDFANAVVLSGFNIPSLRVRRANTEVELKDGQSFAIAGLYSADLQETKKKIPVLGDIPLLGYLFRSKNLSKQKTELLVIATPILVDPLPAGQVHTLPELPKAFELDRKDAKAPWTPPAPEARKQD